MSFKAGWLLILAAYLIVFGALLIATRGLPYAIDNNESFSSLWHARHMSDVPFAETKGLADDVLAWHSAASPYVHTHQGNFPRLFAFVLYLLGARSIESQIAITTFSVGLASIWLAYRFLCSIGPPLFAALGCFVLITDYGLFSQWQIDTYRVWYGFFFFGSLFWVSQLGHFTRWPMLASGIILFASIFYGEYVFASFVGITTCAYALLRYPNRPRILFRAWGVVLVGATLAATVLLAQLAAYMGWENMKLDVGYTLAARNMAMDQSFAEKADSFYRAHRILFWGNYFDVTKLRTFAAFVTSFFQRHLQFYSPWVCLSGMMILFGAAAGTRGIASPTVRSQPRRGGLLKWVLFFATQVLPGVAVGVFSFLALRYLRPLFDDSSAALWRAALGQSPPDWLGWLSYFIATAIALSFATAGSRRLAGSDGGLVSLGSLSLSVIVAYAIVYRFFTGYMFSGYLDRQAPFLVFWTDILLAYALYLLFQLTVTGFANTFRKRSPAILPIAGSLLLVFFIVTWSTLQVSYLIVVPPNGEPFLRLLSRPPYRGHSFVANDYPAPVAEKTHSWAYADTSIFSGRVKLDTDGFSVEHSLHYLWFADADVNKSYLKPEFGILIDQPASISEALTDFVARTSRADQLVAFNTVGIIRRAQEPLQPFLRDQLMDTDGKSYSIVRFDWDFPPFLRPVDAAMRAAAQTMTFLQKLSFSETSYEQNRRWRVEIEPTQSLPSVSGRDGSVLLKEASIDGKQIFSRENLLAAGWTSSDRPTSVNAFGWVGSAGTSEGISAVVVGDNVAIRLLEGPDRGTAVVKINDLTETIDLRTLTVSERLISFSASQPRDKFTAIPQLSPGMYVNTWLTSGSTGASAVVGYTYAQQDGNPEEGTTVRVYNEPVPGRWRLADTITFLGRAGIPVRLNEFRHKNTGTLDEYARLLRNGENRTYEQWLTEHLTAYPADQRREGVLKADPAIQAVPEDPGNSSSEYRTIPLPRGLEGRVQLSVTPGTRTKDGPEFFGLSFEARRIDSVHSNRFEPILLSAPKSLAEKNFPFGYIELRLRFPSNQVPQAEPIVSAGVEEAGDFVYVIYPDTSHIRIGFDHWFKGGPLSPPIAIDYAKEHRLEISMGSFFPPAEDFVFFGVNPKTIADLKSNIWVKLDGTTVLEAPSEFWDSPPSQITIGRNDIKGTTSNARFNGEILESKRIWPDLK